MTQVKNQKRPKFRLRNTRQKGRKSGNENLIELLKPTTDDIKLLLAAQSHIGRRVSNTNMQRYIWKRRKDGVHIINLEKTWNKIQLAARIFCAIKNPQDVLVMSSRTFGQRGAIKFSHYTGSNTALGKWTPGTLCNPQNKAYKEPRLLIVDDPMTCFAALRETSYVGIPVIAFCGVDNNTRFVDCAIPCNNRGRLSIGLIFWLLAREILRMKNVIKRTETWTASVDLFFYRDPDEIKKDQEAKKRDQEINLMTDKQQLSDDVLNQQQQSGQQTGQLDISTNQQQQYGDNNNYLNQNYQRQQQESSYYDPQTGNIQDQAVQEYYDPQQNNFEPPVQQSLVGWDQNDQQQQQQPYSGQEQNQEQGQQQQQQQQGYGDYEVQDW